MYYYYNNTRLHLQRSLLHLLYSTAVWHLYLCYSVQPGGGWTDPELAEFELLVIMSATIEPTSATCQVRTSYLPDEILWGYEFPPVVSLSSSGKYVANFAFFDKVSKAKTMPIFKSSNAENGYQSNDCNSVSKTSDLEKICLEPSYRERGEDRSKRRDAPQNIRISNVWTDKINKIITSSSSIFKVTWWKELYKKNVRTIKRTKTLGH